MTHLTLRLHGDDLCCMAAGGNVSRKPLGGPAGIDRLRDWSRRYHDILRHRTPDALAPLGRSIAEFLNHGDGWLDRQLDSTGPVTLTIQTAGQPGPNDGALLDVPWEILTDSTGFLLAESALRPFRVARRLGAAATPATADHGDLAVLFMAAEVDGEAVLNYEREELAFLDATRLLRAQLAVEETGSLDGLRQRLRRSGRWDVLHLTCHTRSEKFGPLRSDATQASRLIARARRRGRYRRRRSVPGPGNRRGRVRPRRSRPAGRGAGRSGPPAPPAVPVGLPQRRHRRPYRWRHCR